jgi:hypothetical protein
MWIQVGRLAVQFAAASRAARTAVEVTSEREAAIRDVAAGVAAPVLVSFALWIRVKAVRTPAAAVLSRDGQVIYELMRRPAPLPDADLDLEYVYSSRLTWSLAATRPDKLAETSWLCNAFVKSNAADVCARLGFPFAEYGPVMLACGVSLDPEERATSPRDHGPTPVRRQPGGSPLCQRARRGDPPSRLEVRGAPPPRRARYRPG